MKMKRETENKWRRNVPSREVRAEVVGVQPKNGTYEMLLSACSLLDKRIEFASFLWCLLIVMAGNNLQVNKHRLQIFVRANTFA